MRPNTIVEKRPKEESSRATETIRGYLCVENWKGGTRADGGGDTSRDSSEK